MPIMSEVGKIRENTSTSGSCTLGNSDTISHPRTEREFHRLPPHARPQDRITIGPPHPTSKFFISTDQLLVKRKVQAGPVVISDEDCFEEEVYKEFCLLGCFGGRFPGRRAVSQLIQTWPHRCKVFYRPNGFILLQFRTAEERDATLNGPDQFVSGKRLFLKLSPEDGNLKIEDFCIRPVWAVFPDLPRPLWHPNALSDITSMLGDPICMDIATHRRKHGAHARALIYMDTSMPPRTLVPISWKNGSNLDQKVDYENWADFCTYCDQNGHHVAHCPNKEKQQTPTDATNCPNKECPPTEKQMEERGKQTDTMAGNIEEPRIPGELAAEIRATSPPTEVQGTEVSGKLRARDDEAADNISEFEPSPNSDHEDRLQDSAPKPSAPPSPVGTMEKPMPVIGDNIVHHQNFSSNEPTETVDFVHGNDEGAGKAKKKKKKRKQAKPSEPNSDVDSADCISGSNTDNELIQSKSRPLQLVTPGEPDDVVKLPNMRNKKKKKVKKVVPRYETESDTEPEAEMSIDQRKIATQKLKRQVQILFETARGSGHSLLRPKGRPS